MIAESAATEAAELKEEIEYEETNKVGIEGRCVGYANGEMSLFGKAFDYSGKNRMLPGMTQLYTNIVIDDYERAPNEYEMSVGWGYTVYDFIFTHKTTGTNAYGGDVPVLHFRRCEFKDKK
jgi:hypothetical protein